MKTEEIQRTPRGRDPNEVSRALQELTPLSCVIVDRRGRAVSLSSAGYVLRFGHSYHLRLISPFPDTDLDCLRIVNPPPFLRVEQEQREVDEQGRSVRCIPFKVSLDLWTQMRKLGMGVYADELEIVHSFRPGVIREACTYFCPVVARPRWTVVGVAVFLGLAFILLEKLLVGILAHQPIEHVRGLLEPFMRADTWLWLSGVAFLVWFVVNLVNLMLLYRRSPELHAAFCEIYPLKAQANWTEIESAG